MLAVIITLTLITISHSTCIDLPTGCFYDSNYKIWRVNSDLLQSGCGHACVCSSGYPSIQRVKIEQSLNPFWKYNTQTIAIHGVS